MRRYLVVALVSVFLAGSLVGGVAVRVGAQNVIVQAIKLFGIGYVVKTYGSQINDAINTLMLNNKAANKDKTKVVPILSVGVGIVSGNPGSYIGAAQVQGPAAAVNKVQAVAQIEGSFLSAVRLKGLVPVDSLNPLAGNLHRIYGVGVTAIVDFQL
jgi:arginine exporter protein ArgO